MAKRRPKMKFLVKLLLINKSSSIVLINFHLFLEKRRQNILDNVEFFANEEKLKADESKRVGKPNDMNKIFGVEGTFKKLAID